MKHTEQTDQQIERFIKKIAQKFPKENEYSILTDIHVCVHQETGELRAFDDDDNEITRCVISQWIDNKDKQFYDEAKMTLRKVLSQNSSIVDVLGILKPYSFVMETPDKQHLGELYVADDDTIILGGDLMSDLDTDLDSFFQKLMEGNN